MTKSLKVTSGVLILIILLFGAYIIFYVFKAQPSSDNSDEQKIQALIDSTTAPATAPSPSEKELKKLIDSTTAPGPKAS